MVQEWGAPASRERKQPENELAYPAPYSGRLRSRLACHALLLLLLTSPATAQTYRLDVRAHVKPQATLTLDGSKLKRSAVKDDPGFRLQYHFKKAGKTLATIEARSQPVLDIPHKETGTCSVVLEVFYPTYKPGNAQKGQFKPISNVITYRLTGSKAGAPPKIEIVQPPPPVPVLVIHCGKSKGQDEKIAKGFAYKLLQGKAADMGPKNAAVTHCWTDAREVRFGLVVPAKTAGVLRLQFVDGDNKQRKQRVLVQGKVQGDIAGFSGSGKHLDISLSPEETGTGKIDVQVQNLNPAASAVISRVQIDVPAPAQ